MSEEKEKNSESLDDMLDRLIESKKDESSALKKIFESFEKEEENIPKSKNK
jgi:predicted CopG family antitoxin